MNTQGKFFLAVMGVMFFLASCTPMTPNPAKRACNDKCLNTKDSCMVNAMSTDAVSQCNEKAGSCINQKCSDMPTYLEQ